MDMFTDLHSRSNVKATHVQIAETIRQDAPSTCKIANGRPAKITNGSQSSRLEYNDWRPVSLKKHQRLGRRSKPRKEDLPEIQEGIHEVEGLKLILNKPLKLYPSEDYSWPKGTILARISVKTSPENIYF
jgi:hypothetical protein